MQWKQWENLDHQAWCAVKQQEGPAGLVWHGNEIGGGCCHTTIKQGNKGGGEHVQQRGLAVRSLGMKRAWWQGALCVHAWRQ